MRVDAFTLKILISVMRWLATTPADAIMPVIPISAMRSLATMLVDAITPKILISVTRLSAAMLADAFTQNRLWFFRRSSRRSFSRERALFSGMLMPVVFGIRF